MSALLNPRPAPTPAALSAALKQQPELSKREGQLMVGVVAGAHLLALWGLLQVDSVRQAVHDVAPMMVDMLVPPRSDQPPPPPPPPAAPIKQPLPQQPILAAPTPQPVPETAFTAPPPPPVLTPPEAVLMPAPPAPPTPPAPPPPRKVVPATAVRYLVLPPVEVPRASRRAGEHGVVWLRVVVSTQGTPLQVSVQRSSGHARLDEQALWAMRQARFQPHTEDGRPIEVEVTAPIEYPQE